MVARTTSYAISNAALPYLLAMGQPSLQTAIEAAPSLRAGITLYQGELVNQALATALGRKITAQLPSNGATA
jgi:alanine dehydrogenase